MVVIAKEEEKCKYRIERRVFKDSRWMKGWSVNNKNEWSEWIPCGRFNELKAAYTTELTMNRIKQKAAYTSEYRIIKNE